MNRYRGEGDIMKDIGKGMMLLKNGKAGACDGVVTERVSSASDCR